MRLPTRLFAGFLAAACAVLTLVAPVRAQNVPIIGDGNQFGFLDLNTRTYTQVAGAITGVSDVRNIAYDGSSFYITDRAAAGTNLHTLSLAGVAGPSLGTITFNGQPDEIIGLSFNPGGTLYGTDFNTERLLTINPANAAVSEVGVLGYVTIPPISGKLAFVGSVLYGTVAADGANGLYTFDLSTGAATLRGNGGQAALYANMVAFASESSLFGIEGTALYQINTANGALTSLGAITGANLPGSFVAAVVPEPGTVLWLVVAAGLGLVWLVRSRRVEAMVPQV